MKSLGPDLGLGVKFCAVGYTKDIR